jgi:hypothetical protein
VRRDSGESYRAMLTRMAQESGIETPTAEDLARFDRKRKGKTLSNADWKSPTDPDARIAKMKDGTTHLAYKPEHAVDLDTGVVVAAPIHPANEGDATTLSPTPDAAARNLDEVGLAPAGLSRRNLEQLIAETRAPIAMKPGRKAHCDYEYERTGTANLFMLFVPLKGWRHVEVTDHHTAVNYAHVLKDLADRHFPDAKTIVLIQDNLNIHRRLRFTRHSRPQRPARVRPCRNGPRRTAASRNLQSIARFSFVSG